MKYKYFFNWISLKKGFKKGFSVPLLPDSINRINNLPIIRILKIIGGFSVILVLTEKFIYLPNILQWVVLILSFIQLLQIILISMIKVFYGIRILIKNPEKLEVSNSSLNKYASKVAYLVFCCKVGCTVIGVGIGIIVGGAAIDQVLAAGGHSKVFLPFMSGGVRFILMVIQILLVFTMKSKKK